MLQYEGLSKTYRESLHVPFFGEWRKNAEVNCEILGLLETDKDK